MTANVVARHLKDRGQMLAGGGKNCLPEDTASIAAELQMQWESAGRQARVAGSNLEMDS